MDLRFSYFKALQSIMLWGKTWGMHIQRRMQHMSETQNGTISGKANLHFESCVLLQKSTRSEATKHVRAANKSDVYNQHGFL